MPRSRAHMHGSKPPPRDGVQPLLFNERDVSHTEARDHYPTPVRDGVRAIKAMGWDFTGKVVLDPSCGWGNLLEAARLCGARRTIGLELSPDLAGMASRKGHMVACVDALSVPWPRADFIVGNPPFSLALPFTQKLARWCIRRSVDRGDVLFERPGMFLLELDFIASTARKQHHLEYPAELLTLSERISFSSDDGATSKRNYAWFAYGTDAPGTWRPIGYDPPSKKWGSSP